MPNSNRPLRPASKYPTFIQLIPQSTPINTRQKYGLLGLLFVLLSGSLYQGALELAHFFCHSGRADHTLASHATDDHHRSHHHDSLLSAHLALSWHKSLCPHRQPTSATVKKYQLYPSTTADQAWPTSDSLPYRRPPYQNVWV
ncbi:MAG: hypothetical protein AAFR05_21120, partial [Bacteroidota bacterium]